MSKLNQKENQTTRR